MKISNNEYSIIGNHIKLMRIFNDSRSDDLRLLIIRELSIQLINNKNGVKNDD